MLNFVCMKTIETGIPDLFVVEPTVFSDERGYFFESYNTSKFNDLKLSCNFVQDNESASNYGVIRGLHYQLAPFAQTKLVRVIVGKVYDVAVDIRKNSPTFGKCFGIELSDENKLQLYIPQGFAHGFAVISEKAIFSYKCDQLYNKESERGIFYNDKFLDIKWPVSIEKTIVSEKDRNLPFFTEAEMNFVY